MEPIYENNLIRVEIESSEVPWLKIFSQESYKEFVDAPEHIKKEILRVMDIISKEMIEFYQPDKINIASFGNYLPHLHWHVMARFENDSYFPEPVWGSKQRKGSYRLENFDEFVDIIKRKV